MSLKAGFTAALCMAYATAYPTFPIPELPNIPDLPSGDAYKTFWEINMENGFATEHYTVITEDDYVLSLFRIPGTVQETAKGVEGKPVVLIQHCSNADMMEWIWNNEDDAPAYSLSRAGYDVWLGNNRGNRYSHNHVTLTHKDKEYWDFYQKDMADKDLPTFIDFIKDKTGRDNMSYVGHSQGTTQMFLAGALMPDYFAENINVYCSLAPIGTMQESPQLATPGVLAAYEKIQELGMYNWFPPLPHTTEVVDVVCYFLFDTCMKVLSAFMGNDHVDNTTRFDMYISNIPSGDGYMNFLWYSQNAEFQRTALFDYGEEKNQEIYGTKIAPLVPYQDYRVPTGLFSGSLDNMAAPADVNWIAEQLGDNIVWNHQYKLDHLSFAVAKDMSYFNDCISLINTYNPLN